MSMQEVVAKQLLQERHRTAGPRRRHPRTARALRRLADHFDAGV